MGKLKLQKQWIEYEVRDKDGKLLEKGKVKSPTWVGNMIALISVCFDVWGVCVTGYASPLARSDLRDTSGAYRGFRFGIASSGITSGGKAPVGDVTGGIVVGSSDASVAIGQYVLGTLIAHGTASGQLQYGATTVDTLVTDATWILRIIRTFSNGSGATVTVREFGLYLRCGVGGETIMLARDVPTTAISVPAGSTLTLRYIISHTLS